MLASINIQILPTQSLKSMTDVTLWSKIITIYRSIFETYGLFYRMGSTVSML